MKSTRAAHYALVIAPATLIVVASTTNPIVPESGAARAQNASAQSVEGSANMKGESVARLPFARGAVFRCLDDYLAHLERQAAIDLPWWREVRPGVFVRVTTMTERELETSTREELMQRYGFAC